MKIIKDEYGYIFEDEEMGGDRMTDCISRSAVLSAIWKTSAEHNVFFPAIMLDAIKAIPAADVRPVVRGKWIEHYETYDSNPEWGDVQYGYICSLCGRWEYEREPFCNCGARMEES